MSKKTSLNTCSNVYLLEENSPDFYLTKTIFNQFFQGTISLELCVLHLFSSLLFSEVNCNSAFVLESKLCITNF